MKNALGLEVPEIHELIKDYKVQSEIRRILPGVLNAVGISSKKHAELVERILENAAIPDVWTYERNANKLLASEIPKGAIKAALEERAIKIAGHLEGHILPGDILDFGGGSGSVSNLLRQFAGTVHLTDPVSKKLPKGLKFRPMDNEKEIPFGENEFENSLALTVFHHSNFPLENLKELVRVTKHGGRIFILESVFGVKGGKMGKTEQKKHAPYFNLPKEKQMAVNLFFDHLYNRIFDYSPRKNKKVGMPGNYFTPKMLESEAKKLGLKLVKKIELGRHLDFIPEHHIAYVYDVRKAA